MEEKPWSDLHSDLTSMISDQLGLIDLLSFRGVCNYWRSSCSNSSAEIESSVPKPWFMLYGESARCSLLTNDNRIFRIEIPEMAEAKCLASFVGWFLLYCKNRKSLSFFCPFSRAKIEIPQCPLISEQSESAESDIFAAFSSYPTDPDCVVAVVKRKNYAKLKLCLLRRGESEWSFHRHLWPDFGKIKSIALHERAFHFLDEFNKLVAFEYDTMKWMNYEIKPRSPKGSKSTGNKTLDYWVDKSWIHKEPFSSNSDKMKKLLGIEDPCCSISVCGTMVLKGGVNDRVISHEFLDDYDEDHIDDDESKPRRELKGVWFQPRFHQISQDQRW
ncbi:F-box protein At3g56470-like [Neltuma alba]|uniref:F-box protein At3g56470-like n=1 Tax=Neltuma alba TaxID=207710 RepID=UPI0010A4D55A|nr:F-box protein At3g56470-like [Prosopis alba]